MCVWGGVREVELSIQSVWGRRGSYYKKAVEERERTPLPTLRYTHKAHYSRVSRAGKRSCYPTRWG